MACVVYADEPDVVLFTEATKASDEVFRWRAGPTQRGRKSWQVVEGVREEYSIKHYGKQHRRR